ncbi:MAG: hypothetical protein ACYCPT_00510 [Acidimicrobiales bacterium]
MKKQAARLLVRLGLALFIMALLVRPFEPSRADVVADDLAVLASLAVVLVGAMFVRFGSE